MPINPKAPPDEILELFRREVQSPDVTAARLRELGAKVGVGVEPLIDDLLNLQLQAAAPRGDRKELLAIAKRFDREQEVLRAIRPFTEPEKRTAFDALAELWDRPSKLVPFISAKGDAEELWQVYRAAKRLEAGEGTPEDEDILWTYIDKSRAKRSWGYNTLGIALEIPAFAGEFALSGGVATLAKKGGAKLVGKTVRNALESFFAKNLATRVGGKALDFAATAGVQTAGLAFRAEANALQRALPEMGIEVDGDRAAIAFNSHVKDLEETLPAGYLDTFIEVASERSGVAISRVLGIDLLRAAIMKRWMGQTGKPAGDFLAKVARAGGWQGVIPEIGEERVGEALRAILLGDDWNVPSLPQLASEAAAFSVPGAAAAGLRAGGRALERRETEKVKAGAAVAEEARAPGTETEGGLPQGPRRPLPGIDDPEIQRGLQGYVAANEAARRLRAEKKGEPQGGPIQAQAVEPESEAERALASFAAERGIPLVLVEAGERLRVPGAFDPTAKAIYLDRRLAEGDKALRFLYHEAEHALSEADPERAAAFQADVIKTAPKLVDEYRKWYTKRYADEFGGEVPERLRDEEAIARMSEDLAGFIQFAIERPEALRRMATDEPGLVAAILRALRKLLNRVLGTNLQGARVRELEETLASLASTDLERKLDPKTAVALAERTAKFLNGVAFDFEEKAPPAAGGDTEPAAPEGATPEPTKTKAPRKLDEIVGPETATRLLRAYRGLSAVRTEREKRAAEGRLNKLRKGLSPKDRKEVNRLLAEYPKRRVPQAIRREFEARGQIAPQFMEDLEPGDPGFGMAAGGAGSRRSAARRGQPESPLAGAFRAGRGRGAPPAEIEAGRKPAATEPEPPGEPAAGEPIQPAVSTPEPEAEKPPVPRVAAEPAAPEEEPEGEPTAPAPVTQPVSPGEEPAPAPAPSVSPGEEPAPPRRATDREITERALASAAQQLTQLQTKTAAELRALGLIGPFSRYKTKKQALQEIAVDVVQLRAELGAPAQEPPVWPDLRDTPFALEEESPVDVDARDLVRRMVAARSGLPKLEWWEDEIYLGAYKKSPDEVRRMLDEELPITTKIETLEELIRRHSARLRFALAGKRASIRIPDENLRASAWRIIGDKFYQVKRLQDELRRMGLPVPEEIDVYDANILRTGRTGEAINLFERERVEPLIQLMRGNNIGIQEADEYLYARNAPDVNAEMQRRYPKKWATKPASGMATDVAMRAVAQYESGERGFAFRELADMVDRIVAEKLELMESSGLESPEVIAAWKAMYPRYVPLKTIQARREMRGRAKGLNVRGPESLRRKGRTSLADSPLANLLTDYVRKIERAEDNRVLQSFYRLVKQYPDPTMWVVTGPSARPDKSQWLFNPTTGEPVSDDAKAWLGLVRKGLRAEQTVGVKLRGTTYLITIMDPLLARAMRDLGTPSSHAILRGFGKVTRALATLATRWNPAFWMPNFIRDVTTAGIVLQGTEFKDLSLRVMLDSAKALRAAWRVERDPQAPGELEDAYRALKKGGGTSSWAPRMGVQERANAIRKAAERADTQPLEWLRTVREFIGAASASTENATRLSAYYHAKKARASERRALVLAKELTINFDRVGEIGPTLNALYMFFTAGVSGSATVFKALKTRRVKKIALLIAGTAMMLDIVNRAMAGDDDDGENRYDKIPFWIKERNLILMVPGTDAYLKIPLPWGFNTIWALGQQAGAATFGPESIVGAAGNVVAATWYAFSPIGGSPTVLQAITPTVLDPLAQIRENVGPFGEPVRPEVTGRAPRPESQRYWSSVSGPSKAVAEWINEVTGGSTVEPGAIDISPETIDLWMQFIGSGPGRLVTSSYRWMEALVKGEDLKLRDLPFVSRFAGEGYEGYVRQRYYQNLEDLAYLEKEEKRLREAGDTEGRQALIRERRELWQVRAFAKQTERRIAGLRERADRADDEGRARIEQEIEEAMRAFNRRRLGAPAVAR